MVKPVLDFTVCFLHRAGGMNEVTHRPAVGVGHLVGIKHKVAANGADIRG